MPPNLPISENNINFPYQALFLFMGLMRELCNPKLTAGVTLPPVSGVTPTPSLFSHAAHTSGHSSAAGKDVRPPASLNSIEVRVGTGQEGDPATGREPPSIRDKKSQKRCPCSACQEKLSSQDTAFQQIYFAFF